MRLFEDGGHEASSYYTRSIEYVMKQVPGLYQLVIRLRRARIIKVGVLGRFRFPAGWYVYTGSARNGLAQRIRRHLRGQKRKQWHIDYLLAAANGVEAFFMRGETISECKLHGRLQGGEKVVSNFGSSDCGCQSHLAYFRNRPRIGLKAWEELY